MTLLVGPSATAKDIGKAKMELAGRHAERFDFWTGLLQRAKERTKLHSGLNPGSDSWMGVTATPGKSYLGLNYVIGREWTRVELYIDRGISAEDNEAIFQQLWAVREEVEEVAGTPLSWDKLEGKRACRISWRLSGGGYRSDRLEWPEIQDRTIEAMIRFEASFARHLKALVVEPVTKTALNAS